MKRNIKGFLCLILTIMAIFPLTNIYALDDIETNTFSVIGNTLNVPEYNNENMDHYTAEIKKGGELVVSYQLTDLTDEAIITNLVAGCNANETLGCATNKAGSYTYQLFAENSSNELLAQSSELQFTYSETDGVGEIEFVALPTNYIVTFVTKTNTPSATVAKNSTVSMPTNPVATGYIFKGWYTDQTFATTFDFDSPIVRNTTVYAKYNVVLNASAYDKYALSAGGGTVKINDGSASATASSEVLENTSMTVVAEPAENKVFMGWADGSPSGTIVSTNATYTFTLAAEKTLYALFGNIYTITSGANQTFKKTDSDDVLISVNADNTKFSSVLVDGTEVAATNYDTDGDTSTLVSFTNAYVKSLALGSHTVKMLFTDGIAETTLTVSAGTTTPSTPTEPSTPSTTEETPSTTAEETGVVLGASDEATSNPKTGDNIISYMSMLLMSVIGLAGTIVYKKN